MENHETEQDKDTDSAPGVRVQRVVMRHTVDYEHGIAQIFTSDFDARAEDLFHELAYQCFGIRKSIGDVSLLESEKTYMPKWAMMGGAAHALTHHGDQVVWNAKKEKILDEWGAV